MSYDDQNLDQGNRQIAMRIVGGGGWWLVFCNNLRLYFYIWMWLVLLAIGILQQPEHLFPSTLFRTNLKWAFVSIRLSVSPTSHPPLLPFLHPSIHPSLLVNLSSGQVDKQEWMCPPIYLAVSQRSARDVDDQPVEKEGVNIHQEHRVQSDRWRCHHYDMVKEDADDIFRKILLSPLAMWSRMIVLHLSRCWQLIWIRSAAPVIFGRVAKPGWSVSHCL